MDAFKDLRNEEWANKKIELADKFNKQLESCLLYTSPSPRDS